MCYRKRNLIKNVANEKCMDKLLQSIIYLIYEHLTTFQVGNHHNLALFSEIGRHLQTTTCERFDEFYRYNMPKKNKQDDSTSDSGPDDVQPPSKKKKEAPKSNSSSGGSGEEPSWLLENKRFVKVREFRGKTYVDIREYYEKDGEILPGKKGISLSTKAWRKLVDNIEEIDDAIKKVT